MLCDKNLRMNSSPLWRGVSLSNLGHPRPEKAPPIFLFLKRYFNIISSVVAGRILLLARFCFQIKFPVFKYCILDKQGMWSG